MDRSKVQEQKQKWDWIGLRPTSPKIDFSMEYPFSDVKLVSNSGATLFCSRYVLATRSSMCKQMLLSAMRESQLLASTDMVTISFPEMRTEALQVLLQFCTCGCFIEEHVLELPIDVIHVARYFQLIDDMEELVSVVIETLQLPNLKRKHKQREMFANLLSLALKCLPTDVEASFFEFLIKKIFSTSIYNLTCEDLSSKALEFLLSNTVQCSNPWPYTFTSYSSEFKIFDYVVRWSRSHLSKDVQLVLDKVFYKLLVDNSFDINKCELEDVEALQSLANIARPFFRFIDFRLIQPEQLSRVIEPLNIVPSEMLVAAFCYHARTSNFRATILYRGACILQWSPTAHANELILYNSRELLFYSNIETAGFARAYSCLKGGGQHSWIISIDNISNPTGIGIGFCSNLAKDYSEWLGTSPYGWILDGAGKFWHDGTYTIRDDNTRFQVGSTKVQVTVNLDLGKCYFQIIRNESKIGSYVEFTVPELRQDWLNIPKRIYPAVSFSRTTGRVSLEPCLT